jgi:hypothetical protein
MGSRYEPKDHIQQIEVAPQAEGVLDQREITVQSYQTTVPFDFDSISSRIEQFDSAGPLSANPSHGQG